MKVKLKPINEQVVVLMGATSGIGLETARFLLGKGAKVVIVGRSQEGLNDALDQARMHVQMVNTARMQGGNGTSSIEMLGQGMGTSVSTAEMEEQVIGLEADVTDFNQVKSVADQVVQRFGHIDTWVNLAAVSEWALFEDTSPEEFRRIIDVNLVGQANGAMAALPYLKQQSGAALIFVASIAGRLPIPYQSAYNASKHGILGMAETLRLELKHTGVPVSVTSILPASIDTPLFEKARTKIGVEPNPLPPVYDVDMAARAITYAAEHPVRELIVGDSGYMMNFMRRLAPTLTGNYLGATGFREQHTNIPKSAQAPDNMYHHMSGYDEASGDHPTRAGRISVITWFSTHPKARMALYGALLTGVGALIGWRIFATVQHRKSWRYRLPRQAKKTYRQVSKVTGKALKDAGEAIVAMPVVANMPMFRKRSMIGQAGDLLAGWWAALLAIQLPFLRRKSRMSRITSAITDRMPGVTQSTLRMPSLPQMPWNRQPSTVDRLTLASQRKAAAERFAKASNKVMSRAKDQRKEAMKGVQKIANRAEDTRKEAMKAVSKRIPSKGDVKDMASRSSIVERRQSFIERLPFGERRETIIEKVPVKK